MRWAEVPSRSTCPPSPLRSPLLSSLPSPLPFFTTPPPPLVTTTNLHAWCHTSALDQHFQTQYPSIPSCATLSPVQTPLSLPTSPSRSIDQSSIIFFQANFSQCSRTSFSLLSSPPRRSLPTRTCSIPLLAETRIPNTSIQIRMPVGSTGPTSHLRTSSSVDKRFLSSVSLLSVPVLARRVHFFFCRLLGWWNNHDGGFVKMALIKTMEDNVSAKDQQYFLRNENSSSFPFSIFPSELTLSS